jgi:hypothetical protein
MRALIGSIMASDHGSSSFEEHKTAKVSFYRTQSEIQMPVRARSSEEIKEAAAQQQADLVFIL